MKEWKYQNSYSNYNFKTVKQKHGVSNQNHCDMSKIPNLWMYTEFDKPKKSWAYKSLNHSERVSREL